MRRRAGGSSARRAAPAGAALLAAGGGGGASSLEGEVVVDAGASAAAPSSSSSFPDRSCAAGARVRACLHGTARGGRDSWLAQLDASSPLPAVAAGAVGEPRGLSSAMAAPALSKLLYSLSLGRRSRLLLSPLGGRGCDVAPTLNPVAGAGLTHAARDGSSPHSRLGGGDGAGGGSGPAAAAVGWRHRWRGGAGVSAAAFHQPSRSCSSPSHSGGKTSTLIQLDGPLSDSVSAGVVAVLERPRGGGGAREEELRREEEGAVAGGRVGARRQPLAPGLGLGLVVLRGRRRHRRGRRPHLRRWNQKRRERLLRRRCGGDAGGHGRGSAGRERRCHGIGLGVRPGREACEI